MSKIAIIKTGGKQYKVSEGKILKIEKLAQEKGSKVKFDTLLIADKENIEIGQPSLGEKVEAEILNTEKDKKVTVVKYKNKIRYRRFLGHRQTLSAIKITKIA